MEILYATTNKRKVNDARRFLEPLGFKVISFSDLGENPDIEETGHTYGQNARIKALWAYDHFHMPTLGDDSGFEIEAFGGFPGLFSSRFGGNITSKEANQLILDTLGNSSWRNARYICSLVFYDGINGISVTAHSTPGTISPAQRGSNGSGYDPIFIPDGQMKTFAEMEDTEVDQYLHRTAALRKLCEGLSKLNLLEDKMES